MKKAFVLFLVAVCGVAFAEPVKNQEALNVALQVENAFADVVENSKSAVVVITNKQSTMMSRPMDNMPEDFFDFFNFPQMPQRGGKKQGPVRPVGSGSGFFIRNDGHILTNYHVIKDCEFLEVKTADGTVFDNQKEPAAVKIVGYDEESDLAVLLVAEGKRTWNCLKFADSDKLRVGQWAIAIGAPFNLDYSVTIGCVSQKGRTDMGVSTYDSYIQTDASINPGNSGGPLLNIRGEVIGVNQFIVTGGASRGSVGVGFAIVSNFANQIATDLIENGGVSRPFIGISMQDLSKALKKEMEIENGVLVREVLEGEAAEKAGIKAGDVIVSVAGVDVKNSHELLMEIAKHKPGESIELTIIRDGKKQTVKIKAGSRDEYMGKSNSGNTSGNSGDKGIAQLGLRLIEQEGQVIVKEVVANGPAEKAGESEEDKIMPGDVIIDINRMPVKSLADVRRALKQRRKNTVIVYLERKGRRNSYKYFIAIDLGK